MSHGLIRCIALLRVMGSDPIVPSLGLDPPRDGNCVEDSPPDESSKAPGKTFPILLALFWVAIIGASTWIRIEAADRPDSALAEPVQRTTIR